ncbi:hypothetical protein [Xylophilus sp. GOD-11R]|uniref:hypothetical protein n=1 Tax=Xylophilus sp. GOD-11R TaxID=3089814 RepID=UPI00298CBE7B|nr:hypothetical protein [Xylophilus sp. GOD-11R]WPB58651.1 hypothetical protein R9X41_08445 [Xylophilus sp. GOD-11R]
MTTPTSAPVPSTSPTDLLFNAEKLDQAINSAALNFVDRLGRARHTWSGLEAQVDLEATAQRSQIQSAANLVLGQAGYAPPVLYAAGLPMTTQTQTVDYSGNTYAPKPSALPFTTGSTFDPTKFRLIQGISGGDLAEVGAAALIGTASGMSAQGTFDLLLANGGTRNKIINGNFAVSQSAQTGTITLGPNQYGPHDMWRAGAGGCVYTFFSNGIDTVVTIESGTLVQVIEPLLIQGANYCISWAGSSRLQTGGGTSAASPYLPAYTAPGASGIGVEFGPGSLTLVQFEPGPAPTPFERRLYPIELALCQRYACQGGDTPNAFVLIAQANTTTQAFGHIAFPQPMRTPPTFTAAAGAFRLGGEVVGALVPVSITRFGVLVSFAPMGSFTPGDAVLITQSVNPNGPIWNAKAGL